MQLESGRTQRRYGLREQEIQRFQEMDVSIISDLRRGMERVVLAQV
jgi:hypothetical protein